MTAPVPQAAVDRLIGLAILALRPFELYHQWRVKRAYRLGKYRRPAGTGAGAVTTAKRSEAGAQATLTTRRPDAH